MSIPFDSRRNDTSLYYATLEEPFNEKDATIYAQIVRLFLNSGNDDYPFQLVRVRVANESVGEDGPYVISVDGAYSGHTLALIENPQDAVNFMIQAVESSGKEPDL